MTHRTRTSLALVALLFACNHTINGPSTDDGPAIETDQAIERDQIDTGWRSFDGHSDDDTDVETDTDTDVDTDTDTDVDTDVDIPEDAEFSELWGVEGEKWNPDRFGDFSYAGYQAGEVKLPEVSVVTNVKDFGAKGDGSTNDLAAFRAALSATKNGALWVPKGRYLLQSSSGIELNIENSNVVIRGEGSGEDGSVLLVDSPAKCNDDGNSGDCYGTGVLRFGKESNYSSGLSAPLTKVSQAAKRGDTSIFIDDESGIQADDLVLLHLKEDSSKSLGRHLMAEESEPNAKDYNDGNEDNYYWPVTVTRVTTSGGVTRLQLKQPLRVDIRTEWKPSIRRPKMTEEVGLEHLRIDFKDRKHTSHFASNAYNAVDFTGVFNGWIRDVAIRDSDLPIWLDHTKHITLTEIQILPRAIGTSGGHHGITLYRTTDSLLENFSFDTEYVHDVTIYGHSNGNVVRQGSGQNLCIDFHTRLPHENLITCVDFGKGTRPFKSSGPGGRHHSAGREVFWGNYSRNWTSEHGTMPIPDSSQHWDEFMSTFVSTSDTIGTTDSLSPLWAEPVPNLFPCDLYAAQKRNRLP